jgi:hypothetical protein
MRNLTREFFIPKSAIKVVDKKSDAVAYLYSPMGRPCAMVFVGKQTKPAWRYRFPNEAKRADAIERAFNQRRELAARKAASAAERKAWKNPYKVGDLFRRSWGYDQTNIDWYEVVEVRGQMLMVREIAQERVATGDMTGRTTPQPGQYLKGEPRKCRAQDGRIKINDYAHAYYVKPQIVAGVPVYGADHFSTYA